MSGQPRRTLGSSWYSLISTNFQSVAPFRVETKVDIVALERAVLPDASLTNGRVRMEPADAPTDAPTAGEVEHDLVSSSSQSSLASGCSGTWSECFLPPPQRVGELTGDGGLRMKAPASHSLDSLASTAGGADGSGESWTQEETESRSDFSASDDDSSNFSKSNAGFVRSFNRRIRTRDPHGGDLKVISALRAQYKQRERDSQSARNRLVTDRERVPQEALSAATDGRDEASIEDGRRISMVWSPSFSEASSDTQDLCSPVSDDVFWAASGPRMGGQTGIGNECEWRPSPPERRRSSLSMESISESSSRNAVFSDYGDAELQLHKAEGMKPKEGGGMSFLSRFSKTVSTKRKYGKSFKGHALPVSDRKISDVDAAFRESLESIVEGGAERTCDKKFSCQRTPSVGAVDGTAESWVGSHARKSSNVPPDRRAVAEEKDRISVRDLVRNFVVKDSGNGLVVTQARGEKPCPPPRLSKPKSPPLPQNRRLQEHKQNPSHNSDSAVMQTLHNGRVSSGNSPQDQSQTHSRSSSGSFYNMWPQLFSSSTTSKSQMDKDKSSSNKKLPSKPEDPSSTLRQRSHTFTVSKSASTADRKKSPGGAPPSQQAASSGHTSPRRLPQIPRQEASKASTRQAGRNSNQHWPPAAVRNSSPHLAEFASRPQAAQVSAVAQSDGPQGDCPKAGTPPPKRSKFLSTFGFGTESSARKGDADKASTRAGKNGRGRNADEWDVVYTNSPGGPSSRIRRIGAMKKGEEADRNQEGLGVASIQDDRETPTSLPAREHNQGKNVTMGAIPKSSYLNKTFHIMNKDECKRNEARQPEVEDTNSEREGHQGSQGPTRSPAKSARKLGKRVLERSISVPFWTKFSGQENGNAQRSDSEDDLPVLDAVSQSERPPAEDSKEEITKPKLVQTKSSPANFQRKAQHKRTRSYDVTKTFKDELQALPPERSASHDNLAKLKEPLEMPVLAVEFASPESPPQMEFKSLRAGDGAPESLGRRNSVKHRSCNNIIDIEDEQGVQVSPKFARTFKDSKLMSASAFCLTNSVMKKASAAVRREVMPASFFLPGEELPDGSSSLPGGGPGENVYISPYELTTHVRDKPTLQRLMGMFHVQTADPKMDSLVQQLDLYSRQGIPRQPHLLTCQTHHGDEEVLVEDSWRTLVESHEQLDDRQEQQQSAIWELVETEATYIHMLKVITDLFLACLCNLQNESLLCEIDTDKLFSNIQEIYAANLTFWREHVVRMLEEARSSRQPLDPTLLAEAFYKFDELFHPYTRYCLDQSLCQQYCKEKDHDNEYFKMYLAWCETQKECNRLRLMDILVQPMQRLTKYSLLLKAIAKKTNLEDHRISLQDMISHVENFVSNVNSALRHKHEQERLRDIAKRIEAYDAVEARDDELERVVRTYSELNLTQPMPGCPEHLPRHILHHGDLRLRDPHTKMDVHVFLFTDLLLITKVTQRKAEKVKVIRPPYHVERLVLVDLKDCTSIGLVSVNEWNVAVAAFTLQCPDQRTHRTWYDALKRAKEQYKEAQQARDVLVYDDMSSVGHLVPRSPRPGSSRASRVSSLAHSHSGSIDLNDPSPGSTHHPPSVDLSEVRASSASSDDSVAPAVPEIQRSRSLEGGGCGAISPRPDRRPAFPKTPNTLSVTPPYSTGQSLPNLTVESANSLRVPGSNATNPKALSPCNRGVSYPPPSPRTLRRSAPVPQSRNPPLIKSRHVTSMVGNPQEAEQGDQEDPARGGPRRISRTDRMDNRRYHTAGAIDDIKKQDSKDTSIHKRLSWNYGQGPPPTSRDLGSDQGKLGRQKHAVKSISCESMHSSSGVSSTSSLHRSMGSELEALENIDDNELEDGEGTVVDLTVSDCTSLKISPHISTTYICHDTDITLGVCSQYITQPNNATEITVTEGASSSSSNLSSTTPSSDGAPGKTDGLRMREILLNDASVEASDV
ncbi:uncharacterized protein LOC122262639 isoform X2 [Penaeus japonicus]|uniref:uncharacterized protein LOC122262639 isoform X2 n=1 Tax=Penaeus japonicus TaxID=27405 RepID=UPI001C715C1C|nr:uncharacterized protein LOC122262639 isoform X2 [Penaeus japonicus]